MLNFDNKNKNYEISKSNLKIKIQKIHSDFHIKEFYARVKPFFLDIVQSRCDSRWIEYINI